MKVLDTADDARKMDEAINSMILGITLIMIMAALTHWVMMTGNPDPLVSLAIALANGAVGAVFAANHKTWAAQLSGYNKRERWNREQIKIVALGAILIVGTLCAAYAGLKYGTGMDRVFASAFLPMSLIAARLGRNAFVSSRLAEQSRPTSAC